MTSEQINQLMKRLDEISSRQEEYQVNYLSCKNKTAFADIVAESVDLQHVQLEKLAGMISVRNAVVEIAARVYANGRRYDDLKQYGRSNSLILHGCRDLPPKGDDNKVTQKFVISNLNSKLELRPPLTKQDIDICHCLPSNKGKNPVIN